tara:strand:+ start:471 stop:653 length:183 start_codon:yes stop_codon:yes gene_type:complete
MTKQHFEIIAKQLNAQLGEAQTDLNCSQFHLTQLAENLARAFEKINPRFDAERFIKASTE